MKTFILALCVFLAILAFVTISAISVESIANDLKSLAERFPQTLSDDTDDFETTLHEFKDKFISQRTFIHLLIGESEEDSLEYALLELEARQKSGDPAGYASARSRLISAIDKIIGYESLSLYTVF